MILFVSLPQFACLPRDQSRLRIVLAVRNDGSLNLPQIVARFLTMLLTNQQQFEYRQYHLTPLPSDVHVEHLPVFDEEAWLSGDSSEEMMGG